MRLFLLIAIALVLTGCESSSHKVVVSNNQMSATFKNKTVEEVMNILLEKFPYFQTNRFSADIPGDLKKKKISFEVKDVSDPSVLAKELETATGYKVDIDQQTKKISFTAK